MTGLWPLRMAWQDSRGSRRRFGIFVGSLSLGVAALVAINSFGVNLERAIDTQAASLLGADMSMERPAPFPEDVDLLSDSLGGDQSNSISFTSMALFPSDGATRLVVVRAFEGAFPYYGEMTTDPPGVANAYIAEQGALVDASLSAQTSAAVGDSVKIGTYTYPITGILQKVSSEPTIESALFPRVYIPLSKLDSTLLTAGSRAEYGRYFKFDESSWVDSWAEANRDRLRDQGIRLFTVEGEREDWNEGLANVYKYLGLAGFVALLLGSIGIASAIYTFIRQRRETVALLRCLGASNRNATAVYLIQSISMGVVGSIAGALLGAALQAYLPSLLADFIPVDVTFGIAVGPIVLGLATGIIVTTLFALIPLLDIRDVSPLEAIRKIATGPSGSRKYDPVAVALYAAVVAGIMAFAMYQAPSPLVGSLYVVGLLVIFGLLVLMSRLVLRGARWFSRRSSSYTLSQSIANLRRPNNQTTIMMLAVGFGTFLITLMALIQGSLVNQLQLSDDNNRANTILFDIQKDQVASVRSILQNDEYPVIETVPIVNMYLESVNGVVIDDMPKEDRNWAYVREYRSTYRDYISETEEVIEGEFTGSYRGKGHIPVSIEEDLMSELGVSLGDTLVFDVQGFPINTKITSVRKVDWQQVRTNFFFVFPEQVLEYAPRFYVMVTRTNDQEAAANLHNKLVTAHPNVSVIDLSLILAVADEVFSKISFVLRFMALFSIATGILIVGGSVFVGRYYRVQETILLRTIGGSRKQIFRIIAGEYTALGLLASVTGVLLALVASTLLSVFVFNTVPFFPGWLIIGTVAVVTVITLGVGLLNSRGILERPPLDVLRTETI